MEMDWYSARADCERKDGHLHQETNVPDNAINCTDLSSRSYWVGLHLRLEMSLLKGKLLTIVVPSSLVFTTDSSLCHVKLQIVR